MSLRVSFKDLRTLWILAINPSSERAEFPYSASRYQRWVFAKSVGSVLTGHYLSGSVGDPHFNVEAVRGGESSCGSRELKGQLSVIGGGWKSQCGGYPA